MPGSTKYGVRTYKILMCSNPLSADNTTKIQLSFQPFSFPALGVSGVVSLEFNFITIIISHVNQAISSFKKEMLVFAAEKEDRRSEANYLIDHDLTRPALRTTDRTVH